MHRATADVEQLALAAQSGEAGALEVLFERFRPLIGVLLSKYRRLPIAEDLPGEVYLAFVRLVGQYDPGRSIPFPHYISRMLPTALHTIVRREYRAQIRTVSVRTHGVDAEAHPYRHARCDDTGSSDESGTENDPLACLLLRERLGCLLRELTPQQAYVFVSRALEGEEYSRIATTLGSSPESARVLYCKARRQLRKKWHADFPEER